MAAIKIANWAARLARTYRRHSIKGVIDMPGVIRLISCWRAALASLLLASMLWLASDEHSRNPAGVFGLFGFGLFISLGFILFGQQRFEPSTANTSAEDQHLV